MTTSTICVDVNWLTSQSVLLDALRSTIDAWYKNYLAKRDVQEQLEHFKNINSTLSEEIERSKATFEESQQRLVTENIFLGNQYAQLVAAYNENKNKLDEIIPHMTACEKEVDMIRSEHNILKADTAGTALATEIDKIREQCEAEKNALLKNASAMQRNLEEKLAETETDKLAYLAQLQEKNRLLEDLNLKLATTEQTHESREDVKNLLVAKNKENEDRYRSALLEIKNNYANALKQYTDTIAKLEEDAKKNEITITDLREQLEKAAPIVDVVPVEAKAVALMTTKSGNKVKQIIENVVNSLENCKKFDVASTEQYDIYKTELLKAQSSIFSQIMKQKQKASVFEASAASWQEKYMHSHGINRKLKQERDAFSKAYNDFVQNYQLQLQADKKEIETSNIELERRTWKAEDEKQSYEQVARQAEIRLRSLESDKHLLESAVARSMWPIDQGPMNLNMIVEASKHTTTLLAKFNFFLSDLKALTDRIAEGPEMYNLNNVQKRYVYNLVVETMAGSDIMSLQYWRNKLLYKINRGGDGFFIHDPAPYKDPITVYRDYAKLTTIILYEQYSFKQQLDFVLLSYLNSTLENTDLNIIQAKTEIPRLENDLRTEMQKIVLLKKQVQEIYHKHDDAEDAKTISNVFKNKPKELQVAERGLSKAEQTYESLSIKLDEQKKLVADILQKGKSKLDTENVARTGFALMLSCVLSEENPLMSQESMIEFIVPKQGENFNSKQHSLRANVCRKTDKIEYMITPGLRVKNAGVLTKAQVVTEPSHTDGVCYLDVYFVVPQYDTASFEKFATTFKNIIGDSAQSKNLNIQNSIKKIRPGISFNIMSHDQFVGNSSVCGIIFYLMPLNTVDLKFLNKLYHNHIGAKNKGLFVPGVYLLDKKEKISLALDNLHSTVKENFVMLTLNSAAATNLLSQYLVEKDYSSTFFGENPGLEKIIDIILKNGC